MGMLTGECGLYRETLHSPGLIRIIPQLSRQETTKKSIEKSTSDEGECSIHRDHILKAIQSLETITGTTEQQNDREKEFRGSGGSQRRFEMENFLKEQRSGWKRSSLIAVWETSC
jgi:hypothetical protein